LGRIPVVEQRKFQPDILLQKNRVNVISNIGKRYNQRPKPAVGIDAIAGHETEEEK